MKKYERVYEDLLLKIGSGELKPGDKLPTESEIVSAYGFSRITAMAALNKLKADGFAVRRPRAGTFVTARTNGDVGDLPSGEPEQQISPIPVCPIILPYNEFLNSEIILGAQGYGLQNGIRVPFYNSFNEPLKERVLLEKCIDGNIGGIMLYPCSGFDNADLISRAYLKRIPLVFIDRDIPGTGYPLVSSDNEQGLFELTSHFLKAGCKNIGYYGVHPDMNSAERERFGGFFKAHSAYGVPVAQGNIYRIPPRLTSEFKYAGDMTRAALETAQYIVNDFLSRNRAKKCALLCTNDYLAHSLVLAKKSVPPNGATLHITGFDNLERAEKYGFTAIAQDFAGIGKAALELIHNPPKSTHADPARIKVPVRVIYR